MGTETVLTLGATTASLVRNILFSKTFLFCSRFPRTYPTESKIDIQNCQLTCSILQDVRVPGGQQIYVEPTGALGFTQAHSDDYPSGSIFEGFALYLGSSFGSLGCSGLGATGFLACPADASGTGQYKVFADVKGLKDKDTPGGSVRDCIGFDALAVEYTVEGSAVWQYT